MKSLFVLLALVGLAACSVPQECLDYSWAAPAAHSLATQTLESGYNVQNAVNSLWNITQSSNSPWQWSLYYGTDNGNFYYLHDCLAGSASDNLDACGLSSTRYIFLFVDGSALLNYIFYHEVDESGTVDPISFGNSAPLRFNPTNEIWYVNGAAWTDRYNFETIYGERGVVGNTYHVSFTGGVVGADRFLTEPCGTCFESNPPTVWSHIVASGPNQGENLSTLAGILEYVNYMIDVYYYITDRQFITLRAGFSNENYYSVSDCKNRNTACPDQVRFLVNTRNTQVFGNSSVVQLYLKANGVQIGGVRYGAPFTTTSASWYKWAGFDVKMTDTRDTEYTTTYSVPLRGNDRSPSGVISGELYVNKFNECVFNNNNGVGKMMAAGFVAPLVALFALFL